MVISITLYSLCFRYMTGKNLVFTLNNPTYEYDDFAECIMAMADFKFLIFQEERGESGTLHFQGYVEFSNTVRFTTLKNATNEMGLHLERRRGTRDQAITYASKADTRIRGPWEYGDRLRPGQGARSDIMGAARLAMTGPSMKALVENDPSVFLRYSKGLSTIRQLYLDKPREPPVVVLCYGPPGTGKTRLIYDNFPSTAIHRKICTDAFFDGYDGQDVLLLDDFAGRASKMALTDLLGILDRYPYRLPVKGSSTPLSATKIYITTNVHPKLWYDYSNRVGEWKCVSRRINQVVWFKSASQSVHVHRDKFFDEWYEGCDESRVFRSLFPPAVPNNQEEASMEASL